MPSLVQKIENLPSDLEQHYKDIFTDRTIIIQYREQSPHRILETLKEEYDDLVEEYNVDLVTKLTQLFKEMGDLKEQFIILRNSSTTPPEALQEIIDRHNNLVNSYNEQLQYERQLLLIIQEKAKVIRELMNQIDSA